MLVSFTKTLIEEAAEKNALDREALELPEQKNTDDDAFPVALVRRRRRLGWDVTN